MLRIRNLPAADRIAACLETFTERLAADGSPCPLPLSQIELSDFLGLSPETPSRQVRKLCDAGRLRRDGRKLLLLPAAFLIRAGAPDAPVSRSICQEIATDGSLP